ncbi:CRISPR-associated endonuclease Cas2 [Oxynema aestuarii]|jgi:CRISPR-associated protein Cas2|uniref:CRISPR-associated endoribonuclease Cas2 n=1 Tax=Oxynema aestuarii AP17 TaxID=2064643 RepID=A0A6H1TX03_9CYAN|nr:CRISPR-associated endonuclease Cas2 [Oxynema aestuarii]QIZ69869.1 CRISPR-associated endonuclease Cas2 [Oxynema aestuarii AP17]
MKDLLYLIVYDLPATAAGNKRRQRLHDLLCGYGTWKQYSLFECFLDAKQFASLQIKIETLIKPAEDAVCIYVLDAMAVRKTIVYGMPPPRQETVTIV